MILTPEHEHRLDIVIGNLLRFGVLLSAVVVASGALVYLLHHGAEIPSYGVFHGEPRSFTSPLEILHAAFQLQGRGIIQLGLLLLIATPVARVAFSIYAFLALRDWKYLAISLTVFALLLSSLFWMK